MTKSILREIEKLATKVAKEAGSSEKLGEKIEAMKVLTPIYTLLKKEQGSEEETETTMAGLQAQLEEAQNGSEIQHSRRRPDA